MMNLKAGVLGSLLLTIVAMPFIAEARVEMRPWFGKSTIRLSGAVDDAMVNDLAEAIKLIPKNSAEIFLELNSGGGEINAGALIIEELRQLKATGKKLTTLVRNGSTCGSMCVPIFAQGDVRQAAPAAAFMLHSVRKSMLIFSISDNAENQKVFIDVFLEAGVSEVWLTRMIEGGVFDSPQMYWLTGEDLIEQESNLVTELLPRQDSAPSLDLPGVRIWF